MLSRPAILTITGLTAILASFAGRASADPQQRSLEERVTSLERRLDRVEDAKAIPDLYNKSIAGDWKSYEVSKDCSQIEVRREESDGTVKMYFLVSPEDREKGLNLNWYSDKCKIGRSTNPRYPYLIANIEEGITVEALAIAP